jgi:hypothetical protein
MRLCEIYRFHAIFVLVPDILLWAKSYGLFTNKKNDNCFPCGRIVFCIR